MDPTRLWRLEGVIRAYAWGSRTAIPELLGRPPDGRAQAELWLGAHPRAPACVETEAGSVPLDAWIRRDPAAVLGRRTAERFDCELPFLFKVLAAAAPLSIQAHPNANQAAAGFARENAAGVPLDAPHRCYRDPHHKPELICALTPFRALNRFRAPAEIERRIRALAVRELDPLLDRLSASPDRSGLASFLEAWLDSGAAERSIRVERVVAAARAASAGDPACAEVVRLAEAHPGDAGVLAPLFLNLVELAPGEAMFLPAGELHSYLGGTALELMASSDNVLRGGLTDKHVDVPELLATLTFRSGPAEVLRPEPTGSGDARYVTPAAEFSLSVLRLGAGERWHAPAERGAEILLATEGSARVIDARGRALELPCGVSALAPATAADYQIQGPGVVYRAGVGALN